MATGQVSDNLGSTSDWKYYATVAADTNVVTDRPLYDEHGRGKRLPRAFIASVGGNLVVKPTYQGSNVTLPVTAGVWYPISFETMIASGTTATGIIVVW